MSIPEQVYPKQYDGSGVAESWADRNRERRAVAYFPVRFRPGAARETPPGTEVLHR